MKNLAYITDLEKHPGGGGSYAVNWHTQEQLGKYFEILAPGPIVPEVSEWERFVSRLQRHVFRKPGRFFYFSPATLDSNAKKATKHFENGVDGVFFRSATRWCHCTPEIPYFVYLDIVFHTFFENTFDKKNFIASDLQRIFDAEAKFLEGASTVFFESNWGLQKAREAYSLVGDHYHVAGRGGVLELPEADTWHGEFLILLSIAMNFEQKGGDIILQAYRDLKKHHPQLRWHIIGGQPTGNWESVDGIVYEGLLDPDNGTDLDRFRSLLSQAFLLVHPTREDTNPLVLTEAAYFGSPCISVNRFAIPELVINGQTGLLLETPAQPNELADAIRKLINSPDDYREMRRSAFAFSHEHFDWNRIGDRMANEISAKFT